MTSTLYEKWLMEDDVDRITVVKTRSPGGYEWFAQKPSQITEVFRNFEAAIAYATDADR